jgi:hypothetical protein
MVEGSWKDLDRTVDLFELIDAYQKEEEALNGRGEKTSE